ncbi:TALPID3 protein, partial [Buceros rhinoceros silvestris]
SHLISSAVNTGGFQHRRGPSCGLLTEQPKKPEQPLRTNRVSSCQKTLPTSGAPTQGRLLEHALNSQEMPLRQTESSEKAALHSYKKAWHSARDGHTALRSDSFPPPESSFQNGSAAEKVLKNLRQDLGQCRKEVHDLLQKLNSWKSEMNDLIKPKKPVVTSDLPEHHLLNKPSILQNAEEPKSIVMDVKRVLREVQNRRKVLEENLEAVIPAKERDFFHDYLDALSSGNSDELEKLRIRMAVDERIKAVDEEIRAEMARNDLEQVKYDQKVPRIKRAQNIKAMKTSKEIKANPQKLQGCLTKKPLSAAKPLQEQAEDNRSKQRFRTYFSSDSLQRKEKRADRRVTGSAVLQNEDYLCQVCGKPLYQGHRSTLKAPCLRFNSPSPKSKVQRPKVIECVRG